MKNSMFVAIIASNQEPILGSTVGVIFPQNLGTLIGRPMPKTKKYIKTKEDQVDVFQNLQF